MKTRISDRSIGRLLAGFSSVLFGAVLAAFSAESLAKGQSIKQFEAYSIAESLARAPFAVLSTTIPCDGGIAWTLEPPVFHELGAIGIRIWPTFPALVPILAALALFFAIYRLLEHARLDLPRRATAAFVVALSPSFARFGIQFLPDPLAAAFLIFGIDALLRRRRPLALGLFALAILTKALMGTAVAMVLVFFEFHDDRSRIRSLSAWIRLGASYVLTLLPFVAWVVVVKLGGTTSVLHQGGLLEGFLLKGWEILGTKNFYAKFLLWMVIRGTGWILALAAIFFCMRRGKRALPNRFVALLGFWTLGVFPHWFFIRQGNQVHDYYSFSFQIPLALLGVLALFHFEKWLESRVGKRGTWIAYVLLAANVIQGTASLARMKPVDYPQELGRPYFCGSEMRPPSLMPSGNSVPTSEGEGSSGS